MMDCAGNWTGKYGINSRAAFLVNPDAQEKALTDYLNDNERQLRANGACSHIGETIDGLKARPQEPTARNDTDPQRSRLYPLPRTFCAV